MNIDYLIVAVVTLLAIALHVGLYVVIRRWMDRDLALSLAGEDADRRDWMLQCLARARRDGVRRRDLPAWLQRQAEAYPDATPPCPDATPPYPDATPPYPDATPPYPDATPPM